MKCFRCGEWDGEKCHCKDGQTIFHGDCKEMLSDLPKVDLLLADPPYGIGYRHSGKGHGISAKRNSEPVWGDDKPFDPSAWLQFPNVILWGANHFAKHLPHGRWIAWNKLGNYEPWDSFSDVEFAWRNGRGKDRIVSHLWKGLCQAGSGERRWHPTQKPLGVITWCIELCELAERSTILDPFMGSGTTPRAAKNLGHRCIGIEIEEKYCENAADRLRQEVLF